MNPHQIEEKKHNIKTVSVSHETFKELGVRKYRDGFSSYDALLRALLGGGAV